MSFKRELFETALINENHPAVTSHGVTYTYGELLNKTAPIIDALSSVSRVGLFFEKSKDYIASLFAVTLSETAFVPLELTAPKERLSYILNDAEIKVVLTSKTYSDENLSKLPSDITILYFEDLFHVEHNKKMESVIEEKVNEPAYVIYTSGSTGNPKGVEVSFNGLSNVIEQQIEITQMDRSKFYLYLAISFDASLSDIYCSLLSGSELHIYDCLRRNAIGLKDYFNDVGITHSDLPPSFLKLLSPSDFTTLESIIIGGEVADYASVQEFATAMRVINVYGPTEATICTSMIVCDGEWSKPLIGFPLENVGYKIIDEKDNEITEDMVGQIGELIITGCQLANGYLNNPTMNEKSFVELFGERSYRSGDYVSYNEDGLIEFKGRVDRQIKYHGQLINLEEVESAINSIPEVKSVSVIFKNKKMYAYYEGEITEKEIRIRLKTKVPVYMVPSFIINKEIPKTVTGKNDGKLLSKQDSSSDEEMVIAKLFRSILEIEEDVTIDSELSFIEDFSGDSLDFVQLHLALQQMGMNIQYDYLIENNSIKDILNYSEEEIIVDTNFLVKECEKLEVPEVRMVEKQRESVVLLTGSTGLLGSTILNSMFFKDKGLKKVYCLVRGNDKAQAEQKVFDTLDRQGFVFPKALWKRVEVVLGDVSKDNLGMTEIDYNKLVNEVDTVYHCAAEVNNIKSYNQMFNSNVQSTVNMAKFVFEGRDKTLHYASTLSVYVSSDKLDNSVFGEDRLENDGHRLYSGYAQTKWLSEYYLNNLQEKTNNIFIYRFGLLTAPLSNPEQRGKGFLNQTVEDLREIGSIPKSDIELSMDLTPLDAAEIVVRNIVQTKNKGGIFNVSFNYQLTLSHIAKVLELPEMDLDEWFSKYGEYSVAQYMTDINNAYTKQHNMNLFETTKIKYFTCENGKDIINGMNINFSYYVSKMLKA